jgi:alanine racemase
VAEHTQERRAPAAQGSDSARSVRFGEHRAPIIGRIAMQQCSVM